jgi:hypothetical protein
MAVPQFSEPSAGDFRWFMVNRPLMAMGDNTTTGVTFSIVSTPMPAAGASPVSQLPADVGYVDRYGVLDTTPHPQGSFSNANFSYPIGLCEQGYYLVNAGLMFYFTGAGSGTGSVGSTRQLMLLFNGSVLYSGSSSPDLDNYQTYNPTAWVTSANSSAFCGVYAPSVLVHVTNPSDTVALRYYVDATSSALALIYTSTIWLNLEFLGT